MLFSFEELDTGSIFCLRLSEMNSDMNVSGLLFKPYPN